MLKFFLRISSLLACITICFVSIGQNNKISEKNIKKNNYQEVTFEINGFSRIEHFAMYPNGIIGIANHISKTMKYPRKSKKRNIEGVVVVQFLVDVDGKVKDITVLQSVDSLIDREAIRVISKMDLWIPAVQNGHYVKCLYQQSIHFVIE